jgi:hypothetical protein
VKAAKFALRFIYFLSIHGKFHFHFHWCAHFSWKLIHPLIFLWVVPNLTISLAVSSLENHDFFVHPLQFRKLIHLTIIFIGRFCVTVFLWYSERPVGRVDGRVDVMPPSKFHYNKDTTTRNRWKKDFSLNESIFGEDQLDIKCN